MPPIQADGANEDFNAAPDLGEDSGFDQFLAQFTKDDAPPKKKVPSSEEPESQSTTETKQPEEPEAETEGDESLPNNEEEGDEGEGETEAEKKYADSDDATYVKVKFDGKEHEVKVKDLARLWGQEASLTNKSKEVSEQQKRVEGELQKNVAATNALLERAKARFEPYAKVDFVLAAQQLSPEEYTALRNEAMKAHEEVQFLEQHLDGYMQHITTQQQAAVAERAKATLKELSSDDPEKSIPGWDEPMYNELRVYATTKLGVPSDVMNQLVDSWGFRVLHKAMLYDKSRNNNVTTTKVNKTPKKVVKTSNPPASQGKANANATQKAMARLKSEGSVEAAEDAFLARWNDDA